MAIRRDSAVLGKTPPGATHWALSKKGALAWESCTFRSEAGYGDELPIADLGVATIRRRWGDGVYRVTYLALGRGGRQILGAGKIFEISGSGDHPPALRPDSTTPEDHSHLVRALLRAGEGKHSAAELFEALAVPTGMGLSTLSAQIDRIGERLASIERRLSALEARPAEPPAPKGLPGAGALDLVLDKLEAIEQRLSQRAPSSNRPGKRPSR